MLSPVFLICKRALEEGITHDEKEAFRMAYVIREIFDQCTTIDIDAFLKEKVRTSYKEIEEATEWFKILHKQYEEERELDKKRFDLKK